MSEAPNSLWVWLEPPAYQADTDNFYVGSTPDGIVFQTLTVFTEDI